MIKIFKRIRQKLLTENKFSKYLIYAIGEIFLVVIGILIALQVNNYNEQRKSKIKERKYLVSIKNELQNNLAIVKTELNYLDSNLKSQRQLMSLINLRNDTISEIQLSRILGISLSRGIKLKYQDGIFKELLYSGGLIAINSDSIKNEVTSWEGRMSIVIYQEDGVTEARNKVFNYIMENGGLKNMFDDIGASNFLQMDQSKKRYSNKELLKSRKFENFLSFYIVMGGSLKPEYERLEKEIRNLLQMVEEELEK